MNKTDLTVAAVLAGAAARIKKTLPDCQTAPLDASLLLAHVLGKSREELILNRAFPVDADSCRRYGELLERRCAGEPVAYLVGEKAFWLYEFFVTPDVLIPKPDTELLVEKALDIIEKKLQTGEKIAAADVCTGSGCIAVSLLARFNETAAPSCLIELTATDISSAALDVAEKNADRLLTAGTRACLRLVRADLLEPAAPARENIGCFDLIVSNPPYVPSAVASQLLSDGRMEPLLALDGGSDGLDLIRRLIPQSYAALKDGGVLLLETGEYNAAATRDLLRQNGFASVETFADLAGMPRLTVGKKSR